MCSDPAVAARIQSKCAHIGGVAEQEHARQTDQDADNDGLVQLQLIDHQVEDRYDDKGKAGEKRGSDRSRIFDADGAEYVHGGDAERQQKSIFQYLLVEISEMSMKNQSQGGSSDQESDRHDVEGRAVFYDLGKWIADSPQQRRQQQSQYGQIFLLFIGHVSTPFESDVPSIT